MRLLGRLADRLQRFGALEALAPAPVVSAILFCVAVSMELAGLVALSLLFPWTRAVIESIGEPKGWGYQEIQAEVDRYCREQRLQRRLAPLAPDSPEYQIVAEQIQRSEEAAQAYLRELLGSI